MLLQTQTLPCIEPAGTSTAIAHPSTSVEALASQSCEDGSLLLLLLSPQVGYIAYPGKQLLQQAGADATLEEQLLKVSAQATCCTWHRLKQQLPHETFMAYKSSAYPRAPLSR
jgi:hypothetical protein